MKDSHIHDVSPPDTAMEKGEIGALYEQPGFWTRMGATPDSFRRRTLADKHNQLNQTLKPRHLHMIAIGGSIGAGLFVGSGGALAKGGPAALILAFGIIGIMMFNVVYALGELAIMYPVSGGFYTYSSRFISPSWGFAMGWNYVFQWAIVLPLELTVAGFTVEYWGTGVSVSVWVTVFLVAIILVNIFGVLGYGEEEFWSSVLKLAAIVIFIIIAIVLVSGGGKAGSGYIDVVRQIELESGEVLTVPLAPNIPYDSYVGGSIFVETPFTNGFKGVCAVFVTAAFAFSGTELVGLAAAEAKNPRLALPGAVKQVFWRITLFYIVGLLMVGLLVRPSDPLLQGNGGLSDTNTSPFVIAARRAMLVGFDSFLNVVILISVLSIGNSGVYGGSRTLTALAEQGYAPKIFTYVDRAGRPLVSTVTIILFGALAYINESANSNTVFDWLLALSGLAALFTWGSICLAHIRFRWAWKFHGHNKGEIPFHAMFGVFGSWFALGMIFIVLVAQFWVALYPLNSSEPSAYNFFLAYLALPVVLLFWACGYAWKRQGWNTLAEIDVDAGRRELDWEEIRREEDELKRSSALKRFAHLIC